MTELRRRWEQLMSEYLQRNNGDVRLAIEDLSKEIEDHPFPLQPEEFVALLMARSNLEDRLEKNP